MANIIERKSGAKSVLIVRRIERDDGRPADRLRITIGLGKCTKSDANAAARFIDDLELARRFTRSPQPATLEWIETQPDDRILSQLRKHGLITLKPEDATTAAPAAHVVTLGEWLEAYISTRKTERVKESTLITFENIRRNLLACFPADKPIESFTPGDGDTFKAFMIGREDLADATWRRRIGLARQIFNAAMRRKLIGENPFAHIASTVRGNRERFHFVSRDDYRALIEAAPDADWRAIIALSRIGGVRCPSEVLALRWSDVDWSGERLRVTSPKTEHHEGHGERIIPLFPELAEALIGAYSPDDPSEFVVNRYRDASQNLRTTFGKIIRRAGLTPWPKLFNNMRASRATELAGEYPAHVCSAWLGHSPEVAAEHYLRVRDEDFTRACAGVKRVLSDAQGGVVSRSEPGANPGFCAKKRDDARLALGCAGETGRYRARTCDLVDVDHAL